MTVPIRLVTGGSGVHLNLVNIKTPFAQYCVAIKSWLQELYK